MLQDNRKALSRSFEALEGAVTFWLMPYRVLSCDAVIAELERIEPKFEYFNSVTGEATRVMPSQFAQDVEQARALGVPFTSIWESRWLWTERHRTFWEVESITTGIDFREGEQSGQVRALAVYWQTRSENVGDRWKSYNDLVGLEAWLAWNEAFKATRDTRMAAPVALQKPPTTDAEKKTTNRRSKRSSPASKP